MTGITVEGLPEFERTAAAAARELGDLADAHKAAGEVLVNQPQPRTPSVVADVTYDAGDGVTTLEGDVIYAGDGNAGWITPDAIAEITELFTDEIEHLVSTIHGT